MTDYTLKVSIAICGDVITLCHVAEAMARHAATGHGTLPLHWITLNNLLPIHTKSLLNEARAGRLLVCNQDGYQGTVDEIIDAAKNSGDLSESRRFLVEPDWEKLKRENPPVVAGSDVWSFSGIDLGATETDWDMTYGLCICTKLHCLNEWGRTRGDVFHIVDRGVAVVEYGPKNEHGEFAYRGLVGGMSHAPAAKSEAEQGTTPAPDANKEVHTGLDGAPYLRKGTNKDVKKVAEWVAWQSKSLFKFGDKLPDLIGKIKLEAERCGYESARGKLTVEVIRKMLPHESTGGRRKNGNKLKN